MLLFIFKALDAEVETRRASLYCCSKLWRAYVSVIEAVPDESLKPAPLVSKSTPKSKGP